MKISQMFPENKAIDRPINGVIKVMGTDGAQEENCRQELEEYVITRELQKHFNRFFDYYEKSIDGDTEQMGVWISGFFGCGKSHLLKIIRYLLENKEVDGVKPLDVFKEKFAYDPLMFARVQRCVAVPTDVILFNIDSKSPMGKTDDVILRVFTKVFYEKCGFYGDDMKVARFERFLYQKGKLEAFKARFLEINGDPWETARESFAFWEDDIVKAFTEVTSISETAAQNWFNGEDTAEMSIEKLCQEINDYIATKPADYRLLFLVDEVGQYIGDNPKLMLNLQTVVEGLGKFCHGRAWVIVTSQENIDSVTKVKGDDFSKIQGRFNARLSLSSSSVDEVINRRLLEKNEYASQLLGLLYQQNASSLRNLFTFANGTRGDLKGYESEEEFVTCYPFVPYQYKLLQQTLTEVRKHGSSGKHLSDGARSMLSAFQEAALTVKDQEEGTLVPFYRFYDTVVTFLEGRVSGVIDRAWRAAVDHNGLEKEDLDVLKLLFLLKDVQDMPSNLENLTVLMIDNLNADKIAMRRRIAESVNRLVEQNYVVRLGDMYRFLNDDEQDINRAIREMSVDPSDVLREIGSIIFGDLLSNYRKVRYRDRNDYTLDQYIDESALTGATSSIRLRFITSESDYADAVDEQALLLRSQQNEVIVLLSREYDYASELRDKLRINKYVKQKVLSQLPEAIREIVAKKQRDANEHESRAKGLIADAIVHGTFFVFGDHQSPVGSTVKEKVDDAMSRLIEAVYNKLLLITTPVKSDAEVAHILSTSVSQDTLLGAEYANRNALEDMSTYLEIQKAKNATATVSFLMKKYQEPPYGWTQTDIAGLIAALLSGHRVQMLYGGMVLTLNDQSRILNCLLKKTEYEKAIVKIQPHVGHELLMNARATARELWKLLSIAEDETGLCEEIERLIATSRKGNNNLLGNYLSGKPYPGKPVLDSGEKLFVMLLSKTSDHNAFLDALVREKDNLLDWMEDQQEVAFFFQNQRTIFDQALKLAATFRKEKYDFEAAKEQEAIDAAGTMQTILAMPKPYRRISELPTLSQTIDAAYTRIREAKRAIVHENIVQARGDIHTLAGNDLDARRLSAKADGELEKLEQAAMDSTNATELDAIVTKIHAYKNTVCRNIESLLASKLTPIDSPEKKAGGIAPVKKPKEIRRYDLFPAKRLSNAVEVDAYLAEMKKKLLAEMQDDTTIQLI